MGRWLATLRELFLDVLFPRRCVGCGQGGSFLCRTCQAALAYLRPPLCAQCGRPVSYGRLCPRCQRMPLAIDGVRAVCIYVGTIRTAIHELKYRRVRGLAEPLGGLLADYWRAHPLPATVLVPVPLHAARLDRRGYNQSSLLASVLGRRVGLPVVEGQLVRLRDTASQVDMGDFPERWRNVHEAFSCPAGALQGQRVLLVDDVATTTATLNACATALKAAGAQTVWGLVLARALAT